MGYKLSGFLQTGIDIEVVFDNNNGVHKLVSALSFLNENEVEIQPPTFSQVGIYDVYFNATIRKGTVLPNYREYWNPIVTINLTDGIGYTYTSNKIQINIL